MRIIQPPPSYESEQVGDKLDKVRCSRSVSFLRYRYRHHAAGSGYDRVCDFIESETIYPSKALWFAGETLLRPWALGVAKLGGHLEYSRYDWVAEQALIRKMRASENGIFHVVYGEKSLRTAQRLSGNRGNDLIATVHHPKEHHRKLFRSFEHLRACSAVITLTSALRDTWAEIVGDEKVFYVPHGIDTNYFLPGARAVPRRRCLFSGYHGRDFVLLERTARVLCDRYRDFELWIVSSAEQAQRLSAISDRVHVVRRVTDSEYLGMLRHFDLMILPLEKDTANNAMLEAMACGLPLVTTAGAPRDYVDAGCGHMLPIGDERGFIEACVDLLGDESARARFSEGARRRAEDFSWPRIAARTVSVYELLS